MVINSANLIDWKKIRRHVFTCKFNNLVPNKIMIKEKENYLKIDLIIYPKIIFILFNNFK